MGLFVADSIKLGRASVTLNIVQERSCSSTGYLSCHRVGHYLWYFYSYNWLYQSSCPRQILGECSNWEQLMHDMADATADAVVGDKGHMLCTNNTRTSGYVGI